MRSKLASALMIIAVASLLLPGYAAYVSSYVALVACLLSFLAFGWSERANFGHPTVLAILAAILLVTLAVPFVYHGPQDVLAPVLLLPMLSTIALGLLARPARYMPSASMFAAICLSAALVALVGGASEKFVFGYYRAGLGNNPIHYGSLASMVGGLALVGVVSTPSLWRYIFLLGPIFGFGSALVADSRGPMVGSAAIAAVGYFLLLVWLWRETLLRWIMLATVLFASAAGTFLIGSSRVAGVFHNGLNIFHFTGGSDDIRVALYKSAVEILRNSPIVGVGLGQIMLTAQTLFPDQPETAILDNLHADWANFAAMAGSLGLIAWLLLLAAPLLILLDSRARKDRPVILGAILLTTGQCVLGVSNATFGILPQTMVYAVALGYFLARVGRLHAQASVPN